MDEDAAAPGVGYAQPDLAIISRDDVGQRIRAELLAGGVVLLDDGVPPDPARLRRVEIPIGMSVTALIDELRRLPVGAAFV